MWKIQTSKHKYIESLYARKGVKLSKKMKTRPPAKLRTINLLHKMWAYMLGKLLTHFTHLQIFPYSFFTLGVKSDLNVPFLFHSFILTSLPKPNRLLYILTNWIMKIYREKKIWGSYFCFYLLKIIYVYLCEN